jgi:RimJ/RimL family protein N-acetyltransferase
MEHTGINEHSLRTLERIGARRDGILRHHIILLDAARLDSVFCTFINQEWLGVKERL